MNSSMNDEQELETNCYDFKNKLEMIDDACNNATKGFLGLHQNGFDYFSRECEAMHAAAIDLEIKCQEIEEAQKEKEKKSMK